MLKDKTSVPIARELKLRGVRFAIYTGLPPKAKGPPEVRDAPWLEKPVSRETLAMTLAALMTPPPDSGQPTSSLSRGPCAPASWKNKGERP